MTIVLFRNKKPNCRSIHLVQFFAAQKGVVKGKFQFKTFPALHPQFCIFFTVYYAPTIVLIACCKTNKKFAWVRNHSLPFSPTHIISFFFLHKVVISLSKIVSVFLFSAQIHKPFNQHDLGNSEVHPRRGDECLQQGGEKGNF